METAHTMHVTDGKTDGWTEKVNGKRSFIKAEDVLFALEFTVLTLDYNGGGSDECGSEIT